MSLVQRLRLLRCSTLLKLIRQASAQAATKLSVPPKITSYDSHCPAVRPSQIVRPASLWLQSATNQFIGPSERRYSALLFCFHNKYRLSFDSKSCSRLKRSHDTMQTIRTPRLHLICDPSGARPNDISCHTD